MTTYAGQNIGAGRMDRVTKGAKQGTLAAGYIAVEVTQCLSGIMRGAGDTVTPMWISIITSVALRVPMAYVLVGLTKSETYPKGNPAMLFVSLLINWILGSVLTLILYRYGKWKGKTIISNEQEGNL